MALGNLQGMCPQVRLLTRRQGHTPGSCGIPGPAAIGSERVIDEDDTTLPTSPPPPRSATPASTIEIDEEVVFYHSKSHSKHLPILFKRKTSSKNPNARGPALRSKTGHSLHLVKIKACCHWELCSCAKLKAL